MLLMSDKRALISVCTITYSLSIHLANAEISFQKMINETGFISNSYFYDFYNPLCKYTIELVFDNRIIPDKYIIIENNVLRNYPKIYKRLGKQGNVTLIQKILKLDIEKYYNNYVMYGAAKCNNVDVLEYMVTTGHLNLEDVNLFAAREGKFNILGWCIYIGFMFEFRTTGYSETYNNALFNSLVAEAPIYRGYHAARSGNLDIVKDLYSVDPASLDGVYKSAISFGHLDILKFAYEKGDRHVMSDFTCSHLHILEWLVSNDHVDVDLGIDTSEMVALTGNLESLQYLYSIDYPMDHNNIFANAVSSRNIEMMKWLDNVGCSFVIEPMDNASLFEDIFEDPEFSVIEAAIDPPSVKNGIDNPIPILELLFEWGCEPSDHYCEVAARNGNLDVLKFLCDRGCKLSKEVIRSAAYSGYLHIIVWARQQGCEWDESVCNATVSSGNIDVLRWLRGFDRNTCGLKSDETEICPWNKDLCLKAIECNKPYMFDFAIKNGLQVADEILRSAYIKFSRAND